MPSTKPTPEEILYSLLAREEGPILEFKSEIHHIDDENTKVKDQEKDELIKDVIALANGNTVYAGETAYLIFGAANRKNEDGQRETYDVGNHRLTASRILDIVNPACDPRIEDLNCEDIVLDGKHLVLVTIPPTPYLHETTKPLYRSPKTTFSERSAFIRREQSIGVASQKERDTIAQIKRFRFDEKRNPPGRPFGILLGSFVGGILGYGFMKNQDKLPKGTYLGSAGGVAGALFGGITGWASAETYRNYYGIRSYWHKAPLHVRLLQAIASFGASALLMRALSYIISRVLPKSKP